MNLTKKIMSSFFIFSIATNVLALGSDGTRGGDTVTRENIKRLRDLVEKTNCLWKDGPTVLKENPGINEVLKKVSYLDWYFAADLRKEIITRNYCFTGELVKINTSDEGSIVTPYFEKKDQVALRLDNNVYINSDIISQMYPQDRPFLFIHESIHSYIPSDVIMRNQKVRSFVAALEAVFKGKISSKKQFQIQQANNEIDFPRSADNLIGKKKQILFLLGEFEDQKNILMSIPSTQDFFESFKIIQHHLLSEKHIGLIQEVTLIEIINQAIFHEDLDLLQKMAKESNALKEIVLLSLMTSDVAQESDLLKSLEESLGSTGIGGFLLESMKNKSFTIESNRIHLSSIEVLTKSQNSNSPLIELQALEKNDFSTSSPKLKVFLKILVQYMQDNNWNKIEKMTYGNDLFYQAFNIIDIEKSLKDLSTPYPMEKEVALRKVKTIMHGFWILTEEYIKSQTSERTWNEFTKRIDSQRLGYKI